MKIYISFDTLDLNQALSMVPLVAPYVDAIQIGTALIYHHGISVLEQCKKECSNIPLLLDTKILDYGKATVSLLQTVYPTWITVMAGAHNATIHAVCSAAHNAGIQVMMNLVDAISVGQSAMEAANLGVDALVFHQSYEDHDFSAFMDKWDMVRGNTKLPIFISTTITRDTIKEILSYQPDGIIIGAAITQAKKPEVEAQYFYELCHQQ